MNKCQLLNRVIKWFAGNQVAPTPSGQYVLCFDVTSAYTATLRFTQVSDDEATIDWGDGSATQTSGTGTTVAITHSYAVGSYTLTIDSDNMADIVLYGFPRGGRSPYNCLSNNFSACSISSIMLPSGVTIINGGALYNSVLTSLTLPASLTSIGMRAFASCTVLSAINFKGNIPPTMYNYAFENVPSTGTVYVPTGTTADYTTALSNTGLSGWTIVEQ